MNHPNADSDRQIDMLASMISKAISADVINNTDGGFVAIMGKHIQAIRQDVPAAFEMYTLLEHYMRTLPMHHGELGPHETVLAPGLHMDMTNRRVLALIPVGAQELELVAHWITDGLHSATVKQMPGLLALPFALETHESEEHLIPEWWGAYYVNGSEDHCVPILALKSVTADDRFGDWVQVAFERMTMFGLPCDMAKKATTQRTQ